MTLNCPVLLARDGKLKSGLDILDHDAQGHALAESSIKMLVHCLPKGADFAKGGLAKEAMVKLKI